MTIEDVEEVFVENLSASELVEYSRYGEIAIIEELINQGLISRLIDSIDDRGNSMLHMLAANGHTECIKLILQTVLAQSFDLSTMLNRQNNEGNTPLHWACISGQLEVVKLLFEAGATVAIENKVERTPICEAHRHSRQPILLYFEEKLGRKDESEEVSMTE